MSDWTKNALTTIAGDERIIKKTGVLGKMHCILFGNPAVLKLRTRGFASPDLSGFALSEINYCLFCSPFYWHCNSTITTKKAHLVAEVSFSQVIISKNKRLEEVL